MNALMARIKKAEKFKLHHIKAKRGMVHINNECLMTKNRSWVCFANDIHMPYGIKEITRVSMK